MENKRVNVLVGLRLDATEICEIEERKARVEEILTAEGGSFEVTTKNNDNYLEIVYRANIPVSQANKHHAFDSKLNKSWPAGAGAAWVEEA